MDFDVEFIVDRTVAQIREKGAGPILDTVLGAVYGEPGRGFVAFDGQFELNGIGFAFNGQIGGNGVESGAFFAYGFKDELGGFVLVGVEEIGRTQMAFEFLSVVSALVCVGKRSHVRDEGASDNFLSFEYEHAFLEFERAAVFACDFFSGPGDGAFLDVDFSGLSHQCAGHQQGQHCKCDTFHIAVILVYNRLLLVWRQLKMIGAEE